MIYSGITTYEATMLIMNLCGLILNLLSIIVTILIYIKSQKK